jgi:hypothetical protein
MKNVMHHKYTLCLLTLLKEYAQFMKRVNRSKPGYTSEV